MIENVYISHGTFLAWLCRISFSINSFQAREWDLGEPRLFYGFVSGVLGSLTPGTVSSGRSCVNGLHLSFRKGEGEGVEKSCHSLMYEFNGPLRPTNTERIAYEARGGFICHSGLRTILNHLLKIIHGRAWLMKRNRTLRTWFSECSARPWPTHRSSINIGSPDSGMEAWRNESNLWLRRGLRKIFFVWYNYFFGQMFYWWSSLIETSGECTLSTRKITWWSISHVMDGKSTFL